jgi:sugar lactone lactonase YvrE
LICCFHTWESPVTKTLWWKIKEMSWTYTQTSTTCQAEQPQARPNLCLAKRRNSIWIATDTSKANTLS